MWILNQAWSSLLIVHSLSFLFFSLSIFLPFFLSFFLSESLRERERDSLHPHQFPLPLLFFPNRLRNKFFLSSSYSFLPHFFSFFFLSSLISFSLAFHLFLSFFFLSLSLFVSAFHLLMRKTLSNHLYGKNKWAGNDDVFKQKSFSFFLSLSFSLSLSLSFILLIFLFKYSMTVRRKENETLETKEAIDKKDNGHFHLNGKQIEGSNCLYFLPSNHSHSLTHSLTYSLSLFSFWSKDDDWEI